jgi:Type II secretory pathway, component PulD
MTKIITQLFLFLFLISSSSFAQQQDKYTQLQEKLLLLSGTTIPQLNERVNTSVTNVSIQEYLRGVANSSGVNINVDPNLKIDIINNFSKVPVIDVILFLVKQYDLEVTVIGNIINITKAKVEETPPPKKVLVNYEQETDLLSIQCDNEDLSNVTREMVDKSKKNVVPAPGLDKIKVSGYIQNMPFESGLDKFAYANNLKIRKTEDQVYLIEKTEPASTSPSQMQPRRGAGGMQRNTGQGNNNNPTGTFQVRRTVADSLYIDCQGASIADVIDEAANQLKLDVFFTSPILGESTFTLKSVSFPSLLQYIFRNTPYAYQLLNGIYLIGDTKSRDLKEYKVILLQNRTTEKILDIIPSDLKVDLDLKDFPELNSFLVGGIPARISAFEAFLRSIDKPVPVILIEVMLVDSKNTHTITSGIEAGLGDKPVTTQGQVFPSLGNSSSTYDLGSQSINSLINSFNGFGTVKLGNVTPNFYLKLKAMESNGIINIRSTPKLSTLNGHEAKLSIANTQYYQEQTNNLYGSFSTTSSIITNYKEVKAELSVTIKPVVSGDDQITLDIEVKQEDFTDRIAQYAPPGKVARTFKSLIRVKNQEMILLGGLEENTIRDQGTGLPLLSRIPVIKWLFSSKSKENTKSKLNIFIKPTVIN